MQTSRISLELYAAVSIPDYLKRVRSEYDSNKVESVMSTSFSGHFLTQIPPFIIYVGSLGTLSWLSGAPISVTGMKKVK